MHRELFIALLVLGLASRGVAAPAPADQLTWSHNGREDGHMRWWTKFKECGHHFQSPVDLDYYASTFVNFYPLTIANFNDLPKSQVMFNSGHSVQVTFRSDFFRTAFGGGLRGQFVFAQYHFHWGRNSTRGSEHTINTVRYPLEMHLVFYNGRYSDLAEAAQHIDGLAVMAVMFAASHSLDNPALAPLISHLEEIEEPHTHVEVTDLPALSGMLPHDMGRFYRYQGSLTTPPCSEVVMWTVFDQPSYVSYHQLEQFRSMQGVHGKQLQGNHRPTQPLNGRLVYKSFQ